MNKKFKIVLCVLLILVAVLSLTACGSNMNVTKENFDKIVCGTPTGTGIFVGGMTLDEVKEILGEPSDNASSTVPGGFSVNAYVWGSKKKNIAVSFYKGQAIVKVQTGLA